MSEEEKDKIYDCIEILRGLSTIVIQLAPKATLNEDACAAISFTLDNVAEKLYKTIDD